MVQHTCESTAEGLVFRSRKPSVWRDSALGLAASLGVGFVTAAVLAIVVLAIVAL